MIFPAQTLISKHGTIVAILHQKNRFLVIADSRFSNDAGTAHADISCKIIPLDDKHFLVTTGTAQVLKGEEVIFDVNEVARKVFNDFRAEPNTESKIDKVSLYLGLFLKVLTYESFVWQPPAADVPIRNLPQAVIGGTTDSGDLVAYLARIDAQPVKNSTVPLLSLSVGKYHDVAVIGQVGVIGSDEKIGFIEFMQNQTDRAKAANARLQEEIATTANPDITMMKLRAAVQAAIDWADNKHMMGGPLDILELKSGGTIHWIQRKPSCK